MIDIEKDAKALLEDAKKKRAESKGAAPASQAENKKTKGLKEEVLPKEAPKETPEEKAKHDEEILTKKDEELTDDEKPRKVELLKVKATFDAKEKDKTEKSNVQKRIDELSTKVKSLEASSTTTKKERDDAKAELDAMKKELQMTPDDILKKELKEESQKRYAKYLEDDKSKEKAERREMTREELDEWLSDDYVQATDWITRRTMRRVREEEGFVEDRKMQYAHKLVLSKQTESAHRVYAKHPELDVLDQVKTLEEEGMDKKKILEKLCAENPKYKLFMETLNANFEKFYFDEKGPELVVAEMEKSLSPKKEDDNPKIDELTAKLAEVTAELDRVKGIDVSLKSNRSPEKKEETELGAQLKALASEVGLSPEKVLARVKERESKGYGR